MASFVIHTIVGESFLNTLEKKYNITLTDYERKMFLLGNLIVDSLKLDKTLPQNLTPEELIAYKIDLKIRIRDAKVSTHFRDPDKEELCLKVPEPDRFVNKYSALIAEDLSVLGYLFHLYTDKMFFAELFPLTFENLDINKQRTLYEKEAEYIRINKNGQLVNNKEFWASTTDINIYYDYTVMNRLLLELFGTSFAKEEFTEFAKQYFKNPGIEEVDYEKIIDIINLTDTFIKDSYLQDSAQELKVFEKSAILEFISRVPEQFMIEYKCILDRFKDTKKKIRRIT